MLCSIDVSSQKGLYLVQYDKYYHRDINDRHPTVTLANFLGWAVGVHKAVHSRLDAVYSNCASEPITFTYPFQQRCFIYSSKCGTERDVGAVDYDFETTAWSRRQSNSTV